MSKQAVLANALMILGSIVFCLTILLLGELFARYFGDITFLGNSKNLFIARAYGLSHGNAKNVEAVSFGSRVFTDGHGFRVPERRPRISPTATQKAVLILGDSVAFGPGLDEEQTFSGMLRARFPELEVYNSSVIGYSLPDYRNVVDAMLPATPAIDHVFLLFCLNDISRMSAQEIERFTGQSEALRETAPKSGEARSWVDILKGYETISALNGFLRAHSKLYLWLKGVLTDPQARYWEADYRLYQEPNHAQFLKSMEVLSDIAARLQNAGAAFTVIIVPYEYQLRKPDTAIFLPQRKLRDFLVRHSIDSIDSTPAFLKRSVPSEEFFLAFDPMHLSEKGHRIIYDLILDRIGRARPSGNAEQVHLGFFSGRQRRM